VRRSKAVEIFWKIHPPLFRWSGGRLLGKLAGMDVLILTTTGRRSGEPRSTCLTYFRDGDACVVIGSFLGEPRDPGWVHNLRANPEATIELGRETRKARGREASGEERERLWRRCVEIQPDYRDYEAQTSRVIPVVVLELGDGD